MIRNNILYGPKSNVELTEKHLAKLLYEVLKTNEPKSALLIDGEETITNEDFLKYWKNCTCFVKSLGLTKEKNIAIISENNWMYLVAMVTSFALGTPIHFLNPDYTIFELKSLLHLSKPALVYVSKKTISKILTLKEELDYLENIIIMDEDCRNVQLFSFNDAISVEADKQFFEDFNPETQVALIHNSSGTTGLPKGILMTHATFSNIFLFQLFQEFSLVNPNESHLLYLPFFHGYGAYVALTVLFTSNVRGVILKKFQPELFLQTLETFKIRTISIVPTILNFLANTNLTDRFDLSCLKEILVGGAVSSETDCEKVCKRFNINFVRNLYGMAESVVCISVMPKSKFKKGSIGKLFPNRELKIFDKDKKKTLGPNQIGEICIRNPVFKGYINDLEKTIEAIDEDGFLFTGDAGYYDENGFIYLVDRLKDIIKYKSYQVCPTEIELILLKHPAIKDAAVVGKPDERAGELPTAFVVRNQQFQLTENEIHEYLDEFLCTSKKLHGGVKFINEIPKNPTGKVLRKNLRHLL